MLADVYRKYEMQHFMNLSLIIISEWINPIPWPLIIIPDYGYFRISALLVNYLQMANNNRINKLTGNENTSSLKARTAVWA